MAQSKGSTEDHQRLQKDLILALGSRPDVRAWPRFVGYDPVHQVSYGINGETDVQGVVAPHGRSFFIEIKTGEAVLSKDQKNFKKMVLKFGCIYLLCRLGPDRDFEKAVLKTLVEFNKLR
jgi:hypothetical protein